MSKLIKKSLINIQIAFVLFLFNLIITFAARKYFLIYLGPEVLGINTIVTNLLGVLSLAELGIVSAISFSLYKPIVNKDFLQINEIISVQSWLYRNVSIALICISIILMCLFPFIFTKSKLPLWYIYLAFIVYLIIAIFSYLVSFVQIILISDLKEYKVNLIIKIMQFIKLSFQIMTVIILPNAYIWWLFIELLFGVLTSYTIFLVVKKEYPWLDFSYKRGKEIRYKHNDIILKIKQLFFHKFAGIILTQTTPLIIYLYASLTMVTKYENYMIIITGFTTLIGVVFSTLQPAIGNFIAENSTDSVEDLLHNYTILRYFVISFICFIFYYQVDNFIQIWIGSKFVLNHEILVGLTFFLFLSLARNIDPFLYGYGLFEDIYAPIMEAILNITLSILLGYFFGLEGILIGVCISLFIIVYLWKPFFLYSRIFKKNINDYFKVIVFFSFCIILAIILISNVITHFNLNRNVNSYISLILSSIYISLLYLGTTLFILQFNKDFKKALAVLKKVLIK